MPGDPRGSQGEGPGQGGSLWDRAAGLVEKVAGGEEAVSWERE